MASDSLGNAEPEEVIQHWLEGSPEESPRWLLTIGEDDPREGRKHLAEIARRHGTVSDFQVQVYTSLDLGVSNVRADDELRLFGEALPDLDEATSPAAKQACPRDTWIYVPTNSQVFERRPDGRRRGFSVVNAFMGYASPGRDRHCKQQELRLYSINILGHSRRRSRVRRPAMRPWGLLAQHTTSIPTEPPSTNVSDISWDPKLPSPSPF